MSDLSVLEKVTREVVFKGEPLTISPLKVGQIPAFTRAIRPMFAAFAGLIATIPLGDKESGEGGGPSLDVSLPDVSLDINQVAEFVDEHGERLFQAVAIAIRRKKEDVEDMELPDFISLVRAIVEVNADFFGRALNQSLAGLAQRKANGSGLTLSSS